MPNSRPGPEGEPAARKRVSLACQRCRKRKIKCEPSGVAGDGQACLACKTSKSTQCQFLRVNSGEVFCPPPGSAAAPWMIQVPSPERTSFAVVPVTNDLGQYAASHPSQMARATSRQPPRVASNAGDPSGRVPLLPYPGSPHRSYTPASPQTPGAFEFDNNLQSLPQIQTFMPQEFPQQDIPSSWNAVLEGTNGSSDPMFSQRSLGEYGNAPFSDVNFSSTGSPSPSYFPGLSPLVNHLPTPDGLSPPRFLPNPGGFSSQMNNNTTFGHGGNNNFSPADSQVSPETEGGAWTPTTFFSERALDTGLSSCGATGICSGSPSTPNQSSVGSDAHAYSQNMHKETHAQMPQSPDLSLSSTKIHHPPALSENDMHRPLYPLAPIRMEPADEPVNLSAEQEKGSGHERSDPQMVKSRNYRLLQPHPQRGASKLPPLANTIENKAKTSRKTTSSSSSTRHTGKHSGRLK